MANRPENISPEEGAEQNIERQGPTAGTSVNSQEHYQCCKEFLIYRLCHPCD
jgi:hypothetical protein